MFRLELTEAPRTVLWEGARRICESALSKSYAFAAILLDGRALADAKLLVEEDYRRAARYRYVSDRDNFILGRCLIHHLVAKLEAKAPYAFSFGPHGKPFLPGAPAFSLSHSGRWVACAVARSEPVGIDVETFEQLGNFGDLLSTVAHPAERHAIEQARPEQQEVLFRRCWTRKEAALKAIGTGLNNDVAAINVCLNARRPVLSAPAVLRVVDLPVDEARVTVALAIDSVLPGAVVLLIR